MLIYLTYWPIYLYLKFLYLESLLALRIILEARLKIYGRYSQILIVKLLDLYIELFCYLLFPFYLVLCVFSLLFTSAFFLFPVLHLLVNFVLFDELLILVETLLYFYGSYFRHVHA